MTASRRTALLGLLAALPGCSVLDNLIGSGKKPLPGERSAVMASEAPLAGTATGRAAVALPPPTALAEWPQPGGNAAHVVEHPAAGGELARAWTASIGDGSGYRRRITAQPVVAGGRVFTMDSDGRVSAFDAAGGRSLWRTATEPEDGRSTNIGGGVAVAGDTLFASTGRAEILALDAATGAVRWRKELGAPARSAPTLAGERMFVATLDNQVLGLSTADGSRLWGYQSPSSETLVLGLPAPAHVDGIVVAGFGSGELVALRAASGGVAWTDSLAGGAGRTSLVDLSAVRGMPAVKDGLVYAASLGRQVVANDLRSGRRLWDVDVASAETPWVAGDWVFVVSTAAEVAAIGRRDGAVAWVTQLDRWENPDRQRDPIAWVGPVLAGGRLIVPGSTGVAMLVDPATGAVAGRIGLPGAVSLAPVVAGGTVYLVTDSATLVALR